MTHETKAGLVVSSSFLCLLGVVLYTKLHGRDEPKPVSTEEAAGEVVIIPADPKPSEGDPVASTERGTPVLSMTSPLPPKPEPVPTTTPPATEVLTRNEVLPLKPAPDTITQTGAVGPAPTIVEPPLRVSVPVTPTPPAGALNWEIPPARPKPPEVEPKPVIAPEPVVPTVPEHVPVVTVPADPTGSLAVPSKPKDHDPFDVAGAPTTPPAPTAGVTAPPATDSVEKALQAQVSNTATIPSTVPTVPAASGPPTLTVPSPIPVTASAVPTSPTALEVNSATLLRPAPDKPGPIASGPIEPTQPPIGAGRAPADQVALTTPVVAPIGPAGTKPAWNIAPVGAPAASVSPSIGVPLPIGVARSSIPRSSQVESYDEETYHCRPGETFRDISRQLYHNEKYERALQLFNRAHPRASEEVRHDPATLTGQSVYAPPTWVLERYMTGGSEQTTTEPPTASTAPVPAAVVPLLPVAPPPPRLDDFQPGRGVPPLSFGNPVPTPAQTGVPVQKPPAPSGNGVRTYRVRPGDTYYKVARQLLNNSDRWHDLYLLNRAYQPERELPAGALLRLPPDARVDASEQQ